ncbi:MAG: bifunctional nuclease family protein [Verrucomicrobiota bacterium]|nr:bifunctional nuclease family protein [Limisphaera sp.]MDW8381439.1 bifunctional nuclease family protein [Verrucomicrobiota bacterium]
MKHGVVPVQIRGLWPNQSGCALFIGNEDKVFIINVDPWMGKTISDFIHHRVPERPLTHHLMLNIFKGFGIQVERIVITELKNQTFFARLILQQENELGRKLVEVDARPSDCLALAVAVKAPMYVTQTLFDQMEDMSEHLQRINEQDELE